MTHLHPDPSTVGGTPLTPPSDNDFRLGTEPFTHERRTAVLDRLAEHLERHRARMLGYQVNLSLDGHASLGRFLRYHINNVGDPFVDSHFSLHSRWLERAVLEHYARLWHAPMPEEPARPRDEDAWGYVLSMGSTEGNLYALWNARDYLDGNALVRDEVSGEASCRTTYLRARHPDDNPNAYSPVAFFSQETHYSHIKAMRVLDIPTFYDLGGSLYPGECPIDLSGTGMRTYHGWPLGGVPTTGGDEGPGTVDIDALVPLVEFFAAKGHPVLVNFNVGSVFKGAYDDVATACERLRPVFEAYGLVDRTVRFDPDDPDRISVRNGYWVHVDGALGGAYAPYLEKARDAGLVDSAPPVFDFRVPEVSSIVTSGHKYPGAPVPTGIYLSRAGFKLRPPSDPAVVSSPDSTFAGSRSGFASLAMWNHLAQLGEEEQTRQAAEALNVAEYTAARLRELSALLRERGEPWAEDGIEVGHGDHALSVWFQQPRAEITAKYTLACVPLDLGGERHDYSHVYVMPHVSRELVDELVEDLSRPGAFDRSAEEGAVRPRLPGQH
ncbi:pyridoxal-dependent decarboxylase [Streptomyces qinzhouensis]|uniref:pyridoxal-dependent decarboxylase n=1 Tax=Streptomyces qinzhouensis TaxID=2599401 RepID=UPI001FE31868|nr:pyridoxal-dependent decarboxylase [Streptomyces qinzhouensis]